MLIAIDPGETIEIVLSAYEGSTNPPTFACRQFTARERTKIVRLVQESLEHEKAGEIEATDEALTKVFALSLTAWKNVVGRDGKDVPFDPSKLGDLLTWAELWELERLIFRNTQLAEGAKKKSELPAESGQAQSAKSAEAGNAKTATP